MWLALFPHSSVLLIWLSWGCLFGCSVFILFRALFLLCFIEIGYHYAAGTSLNQMLLLLQPLEYWDYSCVTPCRLSGHSCDNGDMHFQAEQSEHYQLYRPGGTCLPNVSYILPFVTTSRKSILYLLRQRGSYWANSSETTKARLPNSVPQSS